MNKEQLRSDLTCAVLRGDTRLVQAIQNYLNFRPGSNKNPRININLYDSGMLMHLTETVERELQRSNRKL